MKDAFDLNSIDSRDRVQIVGGIWSQASENSMSRRLFGEGTQVLSTTGSIPYYPSKATLTSESVHNDSRVAIGAKPLEIDADLRSKAYSFTHKFAMRGSVLKAEVLNLAAIDTNEDLLGFIMGKIMNKIAHDIDKDLKSLLLDTGENEEITATAAWSNDTTARPITDIEAVMDKGANEYDTVVIGLDLVRELSKLNTFKVMTNNYTGTGSIEDSRAPQRAVVDYLFSEHGGLENIVVGNIWYDMNGPVSTVSVGRLFDGVLWAGAKEHLKLLKVAGLDEGDQGYDGERQKFFSYQNVNAKHLRLEKIMGCILTGA